MTTDVAFVAGSLGVGGAERQLLLMLEALVGDGASCAVISFTAGEHYESRIRDLGVPVVSLGVAGNPAQRLVQVLGATRQLHPKILQSSHTWVSGYVGATGRILRIPTIGALRNHPDATIAEKGWLANLALRLPSIVASNSRSALEAAVDLGIPRHRLVLLPNAVDCDAFRVPDRGLRDGEGPFTVLGVGRFIEVKRFDRFVDALALLRETVGGDSAQGHLVGSGVLRRSIQQRAEDLGLDDAALEFTETDDPRAALDQADVLLFCSGATEGTPNVIIEAMASGLPVVATDVGDVSTLVDDGRTGFVVSTDSFESDAVTALRRLMADPALGRRLGMAGRSVVESDYSTDRLAGHLRALHTRVRGAKRGER